MVMNEGFDAYQSRRRFANLDGLRALCILMVLWHHAALPPSLTEASNIAGRGFLGVNFFFVLSGFLITTLLLREFAANGSISILGFYYRRALRIFPAFFLLISVVCFYYGLVKGEERYLEVAPYYFLFMSNFLTEHIPLLYPTWSLAVEEQFYLLWPALLIITPRRWIAPILLGFVVITTATEIAETPLVAYEGRLLAISFPSYAYAALAVGALAAFALENRAWFEALRAALGRRHAPTALLAALAVQMEFFPSDLRGWPFLVIHLTMAATIAALVMRENSPIGTLMRWRPFARLGEISYGVYLYHLIGLHVAVVAVAAIGVENTLVTNALYVVVSLALAEISFRTFERYFLSLKSKQPWRRATA